MYAVIFKARIACLDEAYLTTAARMRELAMERYGCLEFSAATEGDQEIAISYWDDQDRIRAWKNDPEHLRAQELGQTRWYSSYQVEVVEILRSYRR